MMVTHVFFDLHGTLIDTEKLTPCYTQGLSSVMAQRYGRTAEDWREAYLNVMADWDSYYADLDLAGSDGMKHLWEGLYRTTRAMFRLTGTPLPERDDLSALARELPGLASENCDALYPEVRETLERLYDDKYTLGITTHALQTQARSLLFGGAVLPYFNGLIAGVDVSESYTRDEEYYDLIARLAGVQPEKCLVVENTAHYALAAQAVGMHAAFIYRGEAPLFPPRVDLIVPNDLRAILAYVEAH